MALYKSGNPALTTDTFEGFEALREDTNTMTIQGTVNKIAILGILVFASASLTWSMVFNGVSEQAIMPYAALGFITGLLLAFVIIFKKKWAPILAPVYALAEGLGLGAISAYFELAYPGIIMQAIMLTFGILFSLLLVYRMRWIKVTENFKLMVASATFGIMVVYALTWILGMLGVHMTYLHDNSPLGIGISIFVIIIASMNLVVDFDFIESGEEHRAPKYMEWYGAFGLMVTLVWLYIEILRLLSKLRD